MAPGGRQPPCSHLLPDAFFSAPPAAEALLYPFDQAATVVLSRSTRKTGPGAATATGGTRGTTTAARRTSGFGAQDAGHGERREDGSDRIGCPEPRTPHPEPRIPDPEDRPRGRNGRYPGDDDRSQASDDIDEEEDPPTDGRQLLGWAAKQVPDAKGRVISVGKKRGYPSRILDWTPQQVATAYRTARPLASR